MKRPRRIGDIKCETCRGTGWAYTVARISGEDEEVVAPCSCRQEPKPDLPPAAPIRDGKSRAAGE